MKEREQRVRGFIADNLGRIQDRIAESLAKAGRAAGAVTLVAVTKEVGLAEIETLRDLGVTHFGENRIQTAEPKISAAGEGVVWHMVGNIQRRKAKDVVRLFDRVDAVDRIELADELAARAGGRESALPVLLEVNVSGEPSKHGFVPAELPSVLERVSGLSALRVEGLMTMAPFYDNAERARPLFAALVACRHAWSFAHIDGNVKRL